VSGPANAHGGGTPARGAQNTRLPRPRRAAAYGPHALLATAETKAGRQTATLGKRARAPFQSRSHRWHRWHRSQASPSNARRVSRRARAERARNADADANAGRVLPWPSPTAGGTRPRAAGPPGRRAGCRQTRNNKDGRRSMHGRAARGATDTCDDEVLHAAAAAGGSGGGRQRPGNADGRRGWLMLCPAESLQSSI
jgi:hypothetical protein